MARLFGSWHCLAVNCQEYRKRSDGRGQKACQITGYIPGNMVMCPKDMNPEQLARNMKQKVPQ